MGPGVSVEQARKLALDSARRNALELALVDLEAEREVVDRRVTESMVRVHSFGRIVEATVEDAGIVAGSEPPVFRVRIRALVSPRTADPAVLAASPPGGWVPRVAVSFDSSDEGDGAAGRSAALADGLKACGVRVVAEASSLPHLLVKVEVARVAASDEAWTRASWRISDSSADPGEEAVASVSGSWQVSSGCEPDSPEWQRFAVRLAQDCFRVWFAPRTVSVRAGGLSEEDAEAFVRALRRSNSSRIERSLDDATVDCDLTVTGCPAAFCTAVLERAGLAGAYAVQEASMTGVVCAPRAKESAADAAAADTD
jgi:hypothetical protein